MKLALFDLDHTLLPIDSDHSWGAFTISLGWVDEQEFKVKNDEFYRHYQEQKLNIDEYIMFTTQAIREQGMAKALKAREQFMQEVIMPQVYSQAKELVRQYQGLGYECILVTATNTFVVTPIAQVFGFEHLIAIDLEKSANGELTGNISGTPSYQAGKVKRVNDWLGTQGLSLDRIEESVCYSDSMNDLPMLEMVKKAIATNPDPGLEAVAQERGWEILRLFV